MTLQRVAWLHDLGPRIIGRARRTLSWAIIGLAFTYIVYFFYSNRGELLALKDLRIEFVVAILAFQYLYIVVQGFRTKLVFSQASGTNIPFGPWLRIFVIGQFLNTFVPQLGNVYRSVQLKSEHGVSYTRYAGGYLSLAWLGTICNLVVALGLIVVLAPNLMIDQVPAVYVIAGLVAAIAGGPWILRVVLSRCVIRMRVFAWIQGRVTAALGVVVAGLSRPMYLLKFFLLGVVLFLQLCLVFYMSFAALGISVTPIVLVLLYVLLQMSSYVSLTPGNLGVQEVAVGVLADLTGIGMGEGILAAGLLRITGYLALFSVALAMGGVRAFRHAAAYRAETGRT